MFLHGREAHRVSPGQRGHGLLVDQDRADDVASGGVGQRVEDPVDPPPGRLSYNHMFVGYALRRLPCKGWIDTPRQASTSAIRYANTAAGAAGRYPSGASV